MAKKTDLPVVSLPAPAKDEANIVLSKGEEVIFKTQYSWMKFLRKWMLTMGICAVAMSAAYFLGHSSWPHNLDTRQTLRMVASCVAVGSFCMFLFGFLLFRQEWIVLTNHRLAMTSLWNLRSKNLVLRNIGNIDKNRTLFGLLFGYGNLTLSDVEGQVIALNYIPRVDRLESALASASMRVPAQPTGSEDYAKKAR